MSEYTAVGAGALAAVLASLKRFGPYVFDAICRARARQLTDRRHGERRQEVQADYEPERRVWPRRRRDRRQLDAGDRRAAE